MFSHKEKERRLRLAKKLYLQIVKEGDLSSAQRELLEQRLNDREALLLPKRKTISDAINVGDFLYEKVVFRMQPGQKEGILYVTGKDNPKAISVPIEDDSVYHFIFQLVKKRQNDAVERVAPENRGWIKIRDFLSLISTWKSMVTVRVAKRRSIKALSANGINGLIESKRGKCRINAKEVRFFSPSILK